MRIGFIGLVALPNTATAQELVNAYAGREGGLDADHS